MLSLRVVRLLVVLVLVGALLAVGGCHRHRKKYQPHSGNEGSSGPSSGISHPGRSLVPSINWSSTSNPPTASDLIVLNLINAQRAALGIRPLVWHDGLRKVALAHSQDMAQRNYLNLITPEGYDVFQMLTAANPPMSFTNAFAFVSQDPFGESSANYVANYLANPAIAAGLLDPNLTQIGLSGGPGPAGQNLFQFRTFILGQNVTP